MANNYLKAPLPTTTSDQSPNEPSPKSYEWLTFRLIEKDAPRNPQPERLTRAWWAMTLGLNRPLPEYSS